ncbi:adenine deaminase [Parabacteroides sp. OttesenSCG-928-N08]|nr:adenine deaminase [Parabacteroides sp. OttesenSCG-928-N08]
MRAENREIKETIRGNVVDIINRRTYGAELTISDGVIQHIEETGRIEENFLIPAFIDAHVHIESSMVRPSAFAEAVVRHGTLAVVSDPHEIANVMGIAGIEAMIEDAEGLPFYFRFGAPSCVPSTQQETSGAVLDVNDITTLLAREEIYYLSEMMNYPGVLNEQPEVMKKLEAAKKAGKPIDGHAPLLRGEALNKYILSGISTDHETTSLDEGREKCTAGMHILIREGSADQSFEKLIPLLREYPDQLMFCTDDAHPSTILQGHINLLVKRALTLGYDLYNVLRVASYNPAKHYRIPLGFLQRGDSADFLLVSDLESLNIQSTYYKGEAVFSHGKTFFPRKEAVDINNFQAKAIDKTDLEVAALSDTMRVIVCEDGSILTKEGQIQLKAGTKQVESDIENDILKLVIVNRYRTAKPAVAFIKGTGLRRGAVAQSIMHDNHNIIAVGTNDDDLVEAINRIIVEKGGISVVCGEETTVLPLPIAGIMSPDSLEETAKNYDLIAHKIKSLGTPLHSLQMTLSFMGLLVIPSLKLSDKGLFNVESFDFTDLFVV